MFEPLSSWEDGALHFDILEKVHKNGNLMTKWMFPSLCMLSHSPCRNLHLFKTLSIHDDISSSHPAGRGTSEEHTESQRGEQAPRQVSKHDGMYRTSGTVYHINLRLCSYDPIIV